MFSAPNIKQTQFAGEQSGAFRSLRAKHFPQELAETKTEPKRVNI